MTHILAQLQNDWDAEYEASTILPGTGLTIAATRHARIAKSEAYQTWWAGFGDEPREHVGWFTRALSCLRRNGFTDPWFIFTAGYMLTLGAAAIFIGTNPDILA